MAAWAGIVPAAATEPLKDYYQSKGTLRSVDNQPTIEATTAVIMEALES